MEKEIDKLKTKLEDVKYSSIQSLLEKYGVQDIYDLNMKYQGYVYDTNVNYDSLETFKTNVTPLVRSIYIAQGLRSPSCFFYKMPVEIAAKVMDFLCSDSMAYDVARKLKYEQVVHLTRIQGK